MFDLEKRIAANVCGRIMLTKVPDLLFEVMSALPDDVDLHDVYLRAILHRDIIESIAEQMAIDF